MANLVNKYIDCETILRPGDIVTVREDLNEDGRYYGEKHAFCMNTNEHMAHKAGKIVTIYGHDYYQGEIVYLILEDDFMWTYDMFVHR